MGGLREISLPSAVAPHELAFYLQRPERAADGENELTPLSSLAHEMVATRLGPFVRLGLAVIRRNATLGLDPALVFPSLHCRMERTLVQELDLVGLLFYRWRNAQPVV